MKNVPSLIAVMGPTGSGKSHFAELLQAELGAQLINADAFHVYRGFDIGTNKPKDKSLYEMLDIKNPTEDFGVGEWVQLTQNILEELWKQQKSAIVVGGTGLYIRALFECWNNLQSAPDPQIREAVKEEYETLGHEQFYKKLMDLDPTLTSKIDPHNPVRLTRAMEKILSPGKTIPIKLPPFQQYKLGIRLPVEVLNTSLDNRTVELLNSGWIQEVQHLVKKGVPEDSPAMRAIGYRTVLELKRSNLSFSEACASIQTETRQYAKRQRSWLRSEPRLKWIDIQNYQELNRNLVRSIIGG